MFILLLLFNGLSSVVVYLVTNKLIRKGVYFIISRLLFGLVSYYGAVFGCFLCVPYFVLYFTLACVMLV